MDLSADVQINVMLDGDAQTLSIFDGEQSNYQRVQDYYTGETDITPAASAQILATAGKTIADDIIIEPIPSNYGKVSYNGAFILVE